MAQRSADRRNASNWIPIPKDESSPTLLFVTPSFTPLNLAAVIHEYSISVPVLGDLVRPKTPVRHIKRGAPSSPCSPSFPPARTRHKRSWAPLPILILPPRVDGRARSYRYSSRYTYTWHTAHHPTPSNVLMLRSRDDPCQDQTGPNSPLQSRGGSRVVARYPHAYHHIPPPSGSQWMRRRIIIHDTGPKLSANDLLGQASTIVGRTRMYLAPTIHNAVPCLVDPVERAHLDRAVRASQRTGT